MGKEQLPVPSTSRPPRRRNALRVLAVVAGLAVLATNLTSSPGVQEEGDVLAYWDAVSSRGFRRVLNDMYETSANVNADKHHRHCPHSQITPKNAEEIYLTVPTNDSAAAASKRYTSHAHPGGSGWDFVTALQVKNDWERALGLRATGADEMIYDAGSHESQKRIKNGMGKLSVWIDTYYPLLNTPVSSSVTLLTDPPVSAKLREAQVKGDPDSVLADEVRAFHGFSISGDVTGKYVYAGYGRKSDFELLQSKGIDFTDKIVIVKYGRVFRGLKVKAAQEAGAIGCIIYSDPGDDGEVTEANGLEQYPEGPARVPSSVQRGSVQFLSMYPGDPTTPGEPAYPNATRVEGTNIPSIPSLPLSYEDAIPILKALHGKGIAASDLDPSFTGGLGFYGVEEYFTGPSDVDLHLVNEVNTRIMPIWNTMAVIPGYIQDEVVVMGNHRDAWVLGGSDPNSGSSSQYEMVRGLGKLLKKGWRPLRSIVLASWDAEEYGLVGSTEWAEDFGSWLEGNAAAYLNLDASSSGSNFGAAASPTLARVVRSAAEDVEKGSDSSRSVWDARSDGGDWAAFWTNSGEEGETEMMRTTSDDGSNTGIAPLGSGSDYTAFLMRYGVASTDFSFGGGPKDPVYHYHSIYDSHTWLARYGDPGFHKHTEGAKIIGLIALRVADSLILPFNTTQYAYDLDGYLARIVDIKNSDEDFATLDLDSLSQAISQLKTASAKYDTHRVDLLHKLHDILHKRSSFPARWHQFKSILDRIWNGTPTRALVTWDSTPEEIYYAEEKAPTSLPPHKRKQLRKVLQDIRAVNRRLRAFESGFIGEQGITDREWYKHKGTAPGKWLGYGATTFPALTEALTIEHDVKLAQKEADELDGMIRHMADKLV